MSNQPSKVTQIQDKISTEKAVNKALRDQGVSTSDSDRRLQDLESQLEHEERLERATSDNDRVLGKTSATMESKPDIKKKTGKI